jgi:acyl-CoA synthetase (NDP forming)
VAAVAPRLDVTARPVALRDVDLDTFFHPSVVAVIGASDAPGRSVTAMWQKIRAWGDYTGAEVLPVNPNRKEVGGVRCHRSIHDIEQDVDLAVILVGDAVDMFETVLEKKPAFAMIFSAGFAESGGDGASRQERLEALIAAGETRVLGPNTNLNAFEVFRRLPAPTVALITQSGHQGRPLFQAQDLGLSLSHWAPTGNEADLEFADFARYFTDQPEVGAIAAYIEGFKDGRTLMLAADHAARNRVPIAMVKVGRSDAGRSMAHSHTGHLTGNDRVTDGVLAQFGVTRVDGLDELQDVSSMFTRTQPPTSTGVCVYSISGGTGAHLADLCSAAGLDLPSLTDHTIETLRQWIPDYLRVSNPVDCGGAPVMDERGRKILDTLVADPRVGVLLCPITGALEAMSAPLARDLVAVSETTDKPICVVWGSPTVDDPAYAETLLGSGLPVFRTFGNCVGAVKAYLDWHAFADRYRSPFERPVLRRSADAAVAAPLLTGTGPLSEFRSKQVLSAYGIEVTRDILCQSASEAARAAAEIGYPVVMKVSSTALAHKTDLDLVRVGVSSSADAKRTFVTLMRTAAELAPRAEVEGILVSEMVEGGVEAVVGVTCDELFGPTVMFGLGGVFVEVFEDVAFRVPPFDRAEARRMIESTRGAALLKGARGSKAKVGALIDTIMKVQRLAVDHSDRIEELDINPLLVTPDRAVALDALVVTS